MGIPWRFRVALAVPLLLWLPACEDDKPEPGGGTGGTRCERLASHLQETLEARASAADLPGVTASLRLEDCTWHGAAGVSLLSPSTEMRPEDRLRAGSVTKTFVAVVALQLQAEGKLSLEAPLSTWLPDFPRADRITVRQLLNQTSGAADYTQNPDFLAEVETKPGKAWTTEELVAYGAAGPPSFEPGAKWEYSNTNYILVGHIIEQVTGASIAQQLRARILEPLALASTGLDGSEVVPPVTVHGYMRDPEDSSWFDSTGLVHPSGAGAAGALVSTADDLSRFYQALLEGSFLHPDLLAQMRTVVSTGEEGLTGYGLGLMQVATPWGAAFGHNGGVPGFSSVVLEFPERKATLAVMSNREDGEVEGLSLDLMAVVLSLRP